MAHADVKGVVLDYCGAAGDAVCTVLTGHSVYVATNDLNPWRLSCTFLCISQQVYCLGSRLALFGLRDVLQQAHIGFVCV